MASPKNRETQSIGKDDVGTLDVAKNGSAALAEYQSPDIAQFADWSVEQTGFAPYFEPEKGAFFVAYISKADMKDPNFLRYLFQASSMPVKCRRGAKPVDEDAPDTRPVVIVQPGQYFSLSLFFSMVENLNTYLLYQHETGEQVEVLIRFIDKVKTSNNRTVWNVEMRINSKLQPKMNAFRAKLMADGGDAGMPMLPPVPKGGEEKQIAS